MELAGNNNLPKACLYPVIRAKAQAAVCSLPLADCNTMALPMLRPQDRFRPASLHPGSLNWDAPARGGLIQNICEVSARGHGGTGERIPSGVCAKHCVLQVIVEGCESLREH